MPAPSLSRANLSTAPTFRITNRFFEDIEKFIADNEHSIQKVTHGIDLLARGMVMVTKGYAQAKSAGPVAPRHRSNPALAYRIPVQRITGEYFAGWTLKRLGSGHWMLYNDAVEAWLIEYGIYMRVRRPILKMAVLSMLHMTATTKTSERFLDWVIAPRRGESGRFLSFESRMRGTETLAGSGRK